MGLVVEGLECRRDGRRVIAGLGFTLAAGEVRMLRGPNGVGKSTLLRALAGLLPAERGTIALDGAGPGDADAWSERVAYAGHLDAIKPQLTLRENLAFWAALCGGGAEAVERALEAFALGPIAGRIAGACSAGQKRRLGLARLCLAPRALWLLDEPSVALDRAATARFAALVATHAAGGGMALVATHVDLEVEAGPPLVLSAAGPEDGDPAEEDDPFLQGAFA